MKLKETSSRRAPRQTTKTLSSAVFPSLVASRRPQNCFAPIILPKRRHTDSRGSGEESYRIFRKKLPLRLDITKRSGELRHRLLTESPTQLCYCALGVPIFVPDHFAEMMISTLRFCCRPAAVSLLATGLALPNRSR